MKDCEAGTKQHTKTNIYQWPCLPTNGGGWAWQVTSISTQWEELALAGAGRGLRAT